MSMEAGGATVSITRPNDTTAYGAGDVIGAATGSTAAIEFTDVSQIAGASVQIISTRLIISASAVISGETSYTLHLYSITPPSALGDNTSWDLPSGDRAYYLGSLALGTPVDVGSSLYIEVNNINKRVRLNGRSLFGYLVTTGAHTPTAQRVYTVSLETVVSK